MPLGVPHIHGGYTKSYRKELDSEVWLMPPIYHRVWYWLRMKVQHEPFLFPTRERYGIWVAPGQRITSLSLIAEGVKWSEWGREVVPNKKTIKDVLDWLQSREMVTVVSNPKGTLITINNWHSYNDFAVDEVTGQSNSKETRTGHKVETKESKDKTSSPESLRLSGLLADLILTNNPKHTELSNGGKVATVKRWAVGIDRLLRVDRQAPETVETVIRWCQNDPFWQANILSAASLCQPASKNDPPSASNFDPPQRLVLV